MREFDVAVPTTDGHWVSEKFERMARIVEDYDPSFELRWIPSELRHTPEERAKPYVIWDTERNCSVFYAGELDSPEDILERLFLGDTRKGDVLAKLDARNAAVRALEMRAKLDDAEAKMDYTKFLIGTKKNYIQLGNGRKVDDQLRPI